MKKIFKSIIAIAAVLSLAACEKNFDAKIFGSLSTLNFPATAEDYESYAMQCYTPFVGHWDYNLGAQSSPFYSYNQGIVKMITAPSDECGISDGWFGPNIFNGNFEGYLTLDRGTYDWTPNYLEKIREVTRFTKVIADLEAADEEVLSAQKKKELVAECRLIRGILMYYVFHIYGPVPVILDPSLIGNAEAEANWTRPSLDDMSKYIMDDFEFAAENMAEEQPYKGRYTADYARVFVMRHALNEGYHMDGYYKKAYDTYGKFHKKYSLFKEGETPYVDQFRVANEWNCETIMAVCMTKEADMEKPNGNGSCIQNYTLPMDVARTDDKGNPTPFSNWSNWCAQIYNVNPSFYDSFEEGDQRQKCIVNRYYSSWGRGWVGPDQINDLWKGYIILKYPIETNTSYQGNDYCLARWADVMLLRAEADVRLNKTVSSEAISLVNQVRERAGLAGLPASATASVDAFMDALITERGHELFFEDCRKIDLIRFNRYYKTMAALDRIPTAEYFPLPNYAVQEAEAQGVQLDRYYFRDNYDGPKQAYIR